MNFSKKQTWFLIFTTCIVNIMSFASSMAFGWTSPAIPRLNGSKEPQNNPLETPITSAQEAWLASLFVLGSMVGPFLGAPITGRIGRKLSIILFTIPVLICFVLKAFAVNIETLYAARILGGITAGTMLTILPLFIAEISEPHNRGLLSAMTGFFAVIGNLYAYAVGGYVSIKWFSLSGVVPLVLQIALLMFVIPETPYYWISRGREDKAIEVLERYRGTTRDVILQEIELIKTIIASSREEKRGLKEIWKSKATRRSLVIVIITICIQQLSGTFPIQLNMHFIFQEAGSTLSSELSSIVVGVMKVCSFIITLLAVDRMGRRFLLIQSGCGIFLSLVILGTYFQLKDDGVDLDGFSWLPILCLIIFVVAYHSGIGVVPIVQMGEMFPQNMKSMACIVVITVSSLMAFLVTFVFPFMQEAIGMGPSFWIFSSSGLICVIYTYFAIPETKGKTFLQIQDMIKKH